MLLGSLSYVFSSAGLKTAFKIAQLSLLIHSCGAVCFCVPAKQAQQSHIFLHISAAWIFLSCAGLAFSLASLVCCVGLAFSPESRSGLSPGSRACYLPGHLRSSMVRKYWPARHRQSLKLLLLLRPFVKLLQCLCRGCPSRSLSESMHFAHTHQSSAEKSSPERQCSTCTMVLCTLEVGCEHHDAE